MLAGARAVLLAYQDGYFRAGFDSLGLTSFARHYGQGFAGALAALLLVRVLASKSNALVRGALGILTIAGGYAFVSCQFPEFAYHKPRFESPVEVAAHVLCAIMALIATLTLFIAPLRRSKLSFGLAWTAVVLGILLVPVAAFTRAEPAAWPQRPNVILISLDTLRTDHLSCYGYERNTSPQIDRFAQAGTRFTSAHAPHPWTLTSHMSMLTGLLPSEHGVEQEKRLASSVPTLAELYEEAGYNTLALLDPVIWLDQRYGFDRGFASYRRVRGSAEQKIALLDNVFDDLGDAPFFLFLHYFDAHSDVQDLPYESAPSDFDELCDWYDGQFTGCSDEGICASKFLIAANNGEVVIDEATERFILDLYDAGIATLDRRLGALFHELEERGLFENSIVVLTSDHGEEFREHGAYLHGTHYQECISVPLIIRSPNQVESRVSDVLVSHVDLAATLLQLCGLDASKVGGRSYAPLISRGIDTKRRNHVFFDAASGELGVRQGDWKLIHDRREVFLFNLAEDPNETRNLIEVEPAPKQLAELQGLIEAELERLRLRAEAAELEAGQRRDMNLSEDELQELGNIGYAGDD